VWEQQGQARLNVGKKKGLQHHLGGFLGYVVEKNKECLNHIKRYVLPNMVLERTMPSSSIVINGEPHKKKRQDH